MLLVLTLLTGLTMLAGYANKARCTGPEFNEWGRSEPDFQQRSYRLVCYSDIQKLWIGRDIDRHVFPYVHGGITESGELYGGVVEYPVLTGMLIWLGAMFVNTDAGFLAVSALLLAPFGLLTAWWLGKLSRWRALLWALGPPLVLYSFHNWDLAAVACSVGAVYLVRTATPERLRGRARWAAVVLGLGAAIKLYPGIFVIPLALYVLTGGIGATALPRGVARFDVRGALSVLGASTATVVLVNLPFALLGFDGWLASFRFQARRELDVSTNSIWYWGSRGLDSEVTGALVDVLSPSLILASFGLACWLGTRRWSRTGTYPWIQVSAAMLCGFLLLHKVHSPQYTLWLLPFFVLLAVRWEWIASYLVADVLMSYGIFRWLYLVSAGGYGIHDSFAAQALTLGVWGRAVLLVCLFVVFLRADTTVDDERGNFGRTCPAPRVSSGR